MKRCPYCDEEIQNAAIKCRHCGEWLEGREREALKNLIREERVTAGKDLNSLTLEKTAQPVEYLKKPRTEKTATELKPNEILEKLADINQISIKWLRFWIYYKLPISTISGILIFLVIIFGKQRQILLGLIGISYSIFLWAVSTGLHMRRLWAWKINQIILILDGITLLINYYYRYRSLGGVMAGLLVSVAIWIIPNFIYFEKRRILFSIPHEEAEKLLA